MLFWGFCFLLSVLVEVKFGVVKIIVLGFLGEFLCFIGRGDVWLWLKFCMVGSFVDRFLFWCLFSEFGFFGFE